MSKLKLWCYIEGHPRYFSVFISPSETIEDLTDEIYRKNDKSSDVTLRISPHEGALYHDLYVNVGVMNGLCWLVTSPDRCESSGNKDLIRYRPSDNDQSLDAMETISMYGPRNPQ